MGTHLEMILHVEQQKMSLIAWNTKNNLLTIEKVQIGSIMEKIKVSYNQFLHISF